MIDGMMPLVKGRSTLLHLTTPSSCRWWVVKTRRLGRMGDENVTSSTSHTQSDTGPTSDILEVITNLNTKLAAKDNRINHLERTMDQTQRETYTLCQHLGYRSGSSSAVPQDDSHADPGVNDEDDGEDDDGWIPPHPPAH